MVNKVIKSGRIPVVLVGWNMFDAILHIAIDMAEPLRIAGNTIAILVAISILLGAPKKLSFPLLLVAFISTVALNTFHVSENDFAIPMLIFIGLSLYLLLRWAQIFKIEDLKISNPSFGPYVMKTELPDYIVKKLMKEGKKAKVSSRALRALGFDGKALY